MKPRTLFWILLYAVIGVFFFFLFSIDLSLPDGKLHASFLNIGQGDSILITTPKGKHILIDGGPFHNIMEVLPDRLGYFNHTIDLLILTHPHSDHLDGILEVLKRYDVHNVLLSGIQTSGEGYMAFLELIDDKNIYVASPLRDIQIEQGVYLDILSKGYDGEYISLDHVNETSLVLQLRYGDTKMLFTGDMLASTENHILGYGVNIQSDIVKIAHHGSKYSSTASFMQAVSPVNGIISVGKDNRFNHPHIQTISLLKQLNIQPYRTDEQGTIDVICGAHHDCSVTTESHPKVFDNTKYVLVN